jgi:hypothetical protein
MITIHLYNLPDTIFFFFTAWFAAHELRFVADEPCLSMTTKAVWGFQKTTVNIAAASVVRDQFIIKFIWCETGGWVGKLKISGLRESGEI